MSEHPHLFGPRPSRAERRALGAAQRDAVPLAAHAEAAAPDGRPDPVGLLRQDDVGRQQQLLPIRYGRMARTPFTFFRGSASVMAADLARTPSTDLQVQLSGDAHLSNFGLFAAPDRRLVFDLNDFDETAVGPFEWDVKRLAASVAVAALTTGATPKAARKLARQATAAYRAAMGQLAETSALEVWYHRVEVDAIMAELRDPAMRKRVDKNVRKITANNSLKALGKLTEVVDGNRVIVDRPPIVARLDAIEHDTLMALVADAFDNYRASLPADRLTLLDRFRFVDIAHKVVGVGSVGTRCMIILLQGSDGEPLFLQLKEAGPSALAPYLAPGPYTHHGQRVVEGQRLIQAATDAFLGWCTVPLPLVGGEADFYWRQLKDMKGSVEVETLTPEGLARYVALCGATLARAHARSGDAAAIAGYLGDTDEFDRAVSHYALDYAAQATADHHALRTAIDAGQIEVDEES